jgi:hypothetical protein
VIRVGSVGDWCDDSHGHLDCTPKRGICNLLSDYELLRNILYHEISRIFV